MRSVRAKGKIRGRFSLALALVRQQSADDEPPWFVAGILWLSVGFVYLRCSTVPVVRFVFAISLRAVATCHAVRVLTALCALVGRARAFGIWNRGGPVRRFSEMCVGLVL